MNEDVRKRTSSRGAMVSLRSLVEVYYPDAQELGEFRRVSPDQVAPPFHGLLAHTCHMTVTVEAFHGESVDVRVLRSTPDLESYCREILLETHGSKKVVQYGIVRLHLQHVAEAPREEILSEQKPLGRILIEHGVLREIELCDLFEVRCGPVLAECFDAPVGTITYGRTAMIHCDGEPAIELLEIVAPA